MLSNLDKHFLSQRATLSEKEAELVDALLQEAAIRGVVHGVPLAKDERRGSLEASLIKYVLDSREEH